MRPSYAAPVNLGGVMCGHTVSQVVESRQSVVQAPATSSPATTAGRNTLRRTARICASSIDRCPMSTAIGVLGMPGMTAFVGLIDIGQPKPGETVVVRPLQAPSGRSSGSSRRTRAAARSASPVPPTNAATWSTSSGSMRASNYKTDDLVPALRAACPNGDRIYFENVGGAVFAAVLRDAQ